MSFQEFYFKSITLWWQNTIVYNTSLNPAEEIYSRTNDNNDINGNNDNGKAIYKKEVEISNADNKKLPSKV